MARAYKPQVTYTTPEHTRDYNNDYSGRLRSYIVKRYDTYRELKKAIPELLNEATDNTLSLVRSRRGEWGEWYENWALIGGKARITSQGWN